VDRDRLREIGAREEAAYFRDVLGAPGVVVAHDARRAGPRFLSIAVDAYRDAGLDVVVLPGPCSTSYLYYAAMRHPSYAAAMFGEMTGEILL
jgi:phosphomannomutase